MNKIGIIIQREYLTRVRKPSFIIMTFLGPILMAGLMLMPALLAIFSSSSKKSIAVLDETHWFKDKFESDEDYTFVYFENESVDNLKARVQQGIFDGLLYIPMTELSVPSRAEMISKKQLPMSLKRHIQTAMKKEIESEKLHASGIDPDIINSIRSDVSISIVRLDEDGGERETYAEVNYAISFILAIIIYFAIFTFASSVMRGVIEEKTNRIVEVIISSVKPFQLMMGKIIGLGLVGITQFVLWIILTFVIYIGFSSLMLPSVDPQTLLASESSLISEQLSTLPEMTDGYLSKVFEIIHSINFTNIIVCFFIYFIGGYMLYASVFAAIGSAVDNETDSQQFILPFTLPMIAALVVSNLIIDNPDGTVAFWFSIIPFTSPITMLMRLPFDVPFWELVLSVSLLVATFIFMTWISAKVYRTGVLMYGKKITYKELFKWLRY
ncbi:MAG: ABC transporter permease [Lentimicrobiaceae bacterium]|jgi:ABC-2 type transport system permease protein|nr:ABC transporter permease [Lentimicrobiaceae bacterium]